MNNSPTLAPMAEATKRAPGTSITVTAEPVYRLVVTEGKAPGLTYSFDGTEAPRVLLGTSPICELRLEDAMVSRRHLSIVAAGGKLTIRDLGSTNGTHVNGVHVMEAVLKGGESIRVGETTLRVERGEDDGEPLVSDAIAFGRLLGRSVAMRRLFPVLPRLAQSKAPLLVEGETGTGKELLAESIHENGPRAAGPFIVVECATIKEADVAAIFEEADAGTLVLDEIAELDPSVQPLFSRAIEQGTIGRGAAAKSFDVRVITTTRRDLDREVESGRFREDLFFRLAVTRIEMPPLRERGGDVSYLAETFWKSAGGGAFPTDALERTGGYPWPGNVRELASWVTRLAAMGDAPPAARTSISKGGDFLDGVIAEHLPLGSARERVVAEFEKRYVEDAFERNGRNVTKAAASAGIARRYFRALRAKQK